MDTKLAHFLIDLSLYQEKFEDSRRILKLT